MKSVQVLENKVGTGTACKGKETFTFAGEIQMARKYCPLACSFQDFSEKRECSLFGLCAYWYKYGMSLFNQL